MPDDWVFDTTSPSSSVKRRLSIHKDDSNHDFKRICIQPLVQSYSSGITTTPNQILTSGGTQDDGLQYEFMDTLQQQVYDNSFSAQLSPQDDIMAMPWPNIHGSVPVGGASQVNSCWIAPFHSGDIETEPRSLGFQSEMFREEVVEGQNLYPMNVSPLPSFHQAQLILTVGSLTLKLAHSTPMLSNFTEM